jgi:hypothetical protein
MFVTGCTVILNARLCLEKGSSACFLALRECEVRRFERLTIGLSCVYFWLHAHPCGGFWCFQSARSESLVLSVYYLMLGNI